MDNNGSGNGAVHVAADSIQYRITFAPGNDQKYGFDAHDERYPSLKTEYGSALVHGSTVSVPWKSVAAGNIDRVTAKSEEGPITKELAFKGELGPINVLTGTDPNEKSLMVTGRGDGQEEAVSAYLLKEDEEGKQREEIQGQLNVVSYDQVRQQVYLVNVDGNGDNINTGALRNELNSIYGQAVVQWELGTIALNNVDWNLKGDGMLDDGTTGTFSNYTKEMKALIKALEKQGDIEKDAYYLFAMKRSASRRKLGFMPRKKQFGFIFIEGLGGNDLSKVVAHELAHGAFRLKHTFSEHPELAQGSTDNLLDYGQGSHLMKWQWDLIHDPVAMIGWLDKDGEGAYIPDCAGNNFSLGTMRYDLKKKLDDKASLFAQVRLAFDNIYKEVVCNDKNEPVHNHADWYVRKAAINKDKKNLTIPEKIILKMLKEERPSFNLHPKGVYMGDYDIEGEDYQIAIYSETGSFSLEKISVTDICSLADNERVLVDVKDDNVTIMFLDQGNLKMTLQIMKGGKETAILWLKYLCIIIDEELPVPEVINFWENLFTDEEVDQNQDFVLQLIEGEDVQEDSVTLLITDEPQMPDIRGQVALEGNDNIEVEMKLVIEYSRTCPGAPSRSRRDITSFPASGWQKIKTNEVWDIDFGQDNSVGTQRPMIRGGRASLMFRYGEEEGDTLIFLIKGENPTIESVMDALDEAPYDDIWFLKKMALHESGTRNPTDNNSRARQFNPENTCCENLAEDWGAYSRCPTMGPPCGWGLMQMDLPAPTAQSMWDWRANIRQAYNLLDGEKRRTVINRMRRNMRRINNWNRANPNNEVLGHEDHEEGGIEYTHTSSDEFQNTGITNFDSHFEDETNGNNRSFLDACWIKTYNGLGREGKIFYYIRTDTQPDNKPTWDISNTATWGTGNNTSVNYYVEEISEQETPDD